MMMLLCCGKNNDDDDPTLCPFKEPRWTLSIIAALGGHSNIMIYSRCDLLLVCGVSLVWDRCDETAFPGVRVTILVHKSSFIVSHTRPSLTQYRHGCVGA